MFALCNDLYGNGITVHDVHLRIMPVLQAMAVKCWTGQLTTVPYDSFETQRKKLGEAPGVNESGRVPNLPVKISDLQPNITLSLPVHEVGYGHKISFSIDCKPEQKGTILTTGPDATFYLSDPVSGKLGFQRESYFDHFDYALPKEGHVEITIENTSSATNLYVNGQLKEKLEQIRFYVVKPTDKANHMPGRTWQLDAYEPERSMRYQRALFFPVQKTGNFNSRVTNLTIDKE